MSRSYRRRAGELLAAVQPRLQEIRQLDADAQVRAMAAQVLALASANKTAAIADLQRAFAAEPNDMTRGDIAEAVVRAGWFSGDARLGSEVRASALGVVDLGGQHSQCRA